MKKVAIFTEASINEFAPAIFVLGTISGMAAVIAGLKKEPAIATTVETMKSAIRIVSLA